MIAIILSFLGNFFGLLAVGFLVPGFRVELSVASLLITALLLTALNATLKPVLKLFAAPLILITLGLFTIIINAAVLWTLDFISERVTISSIQSLFVGALIISVIHAIASLIGKTLHNRS